MRRGGGVHVKIGCIKYYECLECTLQDGQGHISASPIVKFASLIHRGTISGGWRPC